MNKTINKIVINSNRDYYDTDVVIEESNNQSDNEEE